MAASNLPKQAGKKTWVMKEERKSKAPKDEAGWKDRVPVTASPDDKHSHYTLASVWDTSATTCCGCGGKVRTKPSGNPPPPLFDVLLKRYECQIFKKRGDKKFRISKNKEAVYYHPNANCLAQKHGEGNATSITVPDQIRPQLLQAHMTIL